MDNYYADAFDPLAPYTGVMDLNHPFTVSRNVTLPPPLVATMVNWIIDGDRVSI